MRPILPLLVALGLALAACRDPNNGSIVPPYATPTADPVVAATPTTDLATPRAPAAVVPNDRQGGPGTGGPTGSPNREKP